MRLMLDLLILFGATWILIKGTELVINNLNHLAKQAKFAKYGLAAIVVAVATSFPELFVGISSAIGDVPNLALGNVIGSNIANVALAVGLAAVVVGKIDIRGEYGRSDLFYSALVGAVPLILLSDGRMNRLEGLSLLVSYAIYLRYFFRKSHPEPLQVKNVVAGRFWRRIDGIRSGLRQRTLWRLLFGLGVMLITSELIVRTAVDLGELLNLPVLLVGLFAIAIGTSLPEISISIRSAARREASVLYGNILGSIIANALLVVGVVAVIKPIEVMAIESYLIATIGYVVIFFSFWVFTRSKRTLDRREGAVLVIMYLVFFLVEFLKENGYGPELQQWFDWLSSQATLFV